VESLDALDLTYAFFISNEIFDAFPCELYIDAKVADIRQNAVVWREADAAHIEHAQKHGMQKGEIAVGYEAFARRIVRAAKRFDFVSFDYGERYARNDFSIRIYAKHTVHPFFDDEVNLSELFGRSDMTYDVNFGHVIDAFEAEGVTLVDYEAQARALIRFGLIDLLEQYARHSTEMQYLHEADKIKTLIAPNVMGERFKMVHFKK
jgi:SAM-dependent MidA family methyltransferase